MISSIMLGDAPTDDSAFFFGFMGVVSALVFANIGSAYGCSKAGLGISYFGVIRPEGIIKAIIPVIMAGILGIYGLVVAVLLIAKVKKDDYSMYQGFAHLASGLCCGLSCLAAGLSIGIIGDAGARALAQTDRVFIGMMLMLILAEAIALLGLIISIMLIV